MKKIFLLFLLVICATFCAHAQYNKQRYGYNENPRIGLCITGAGLTFTLAGVLTAPDYMWVSTSNTTGQWQKKPFLKQGARSMCIVTDVTLTCAGLITMLAGK